MKEPKGDSQRLSVRTKVVDESSYLQRPHESSWRLPLQFLNGRSHLLEQSFHFLQTRGWICVHHKSQVYPAIPSPSRSRAGRINWACRGIPRDRQNFFVTPIDDFT